MTAALFALLVLGADPLDPDVAKVKQLFDSGKYEATLNTAEDALERSDLPLTETDRSELHRYAGMAAFVLSKDDQARRHFLTFMKANPDGELDPFVATPTAIQFFEKLRTENAHELDQIRQRKRQEAIDLAQKRRDEANRRRVLEEMSRRVTTRTVEKRNFLVNFLPFGAGQFQQGRTRPGIAFLAIEGTLAIVSISAWVFRWALASCGADCQTKTWLLGTDQGDVPVVSTGAPLANTRAMTNSRYFQYISAGLFYSVWAAGVTDSIYHHEDLVQTGTDTTLIPPETAPSPEPGKGDRIPIGPGPRGSLDLHPFLFPTLGGLGGGLSLHF